MDPPRLLLPLPGQEQTKGELKAFRFRYAFFLQLPAYGGGEEI